MTERQARDKLTTMRKEPGQKFHSLGVEILTLSRIAYPDMAGAHFEVIALESVRRCIENKHLIRACVGVAAACQVTSSRI